MPGSALIDDTQSMVAPPEFNPRLQKFSGALSLLNTLLLILLGIVLLVFPKDVIHILLDYGAGSDDDAMSAGKEI
eukprot:scaffold14145_cov93-Cylindrotheca_fusiformis.AAC.1